MDPTQTNPSPQTPENNQSEYQKILDKYAQELAQIEEVEVNNNVTPPPQFSESTPLPVDTPITAPAPKVESLSLPVETVDTSTSSQSDNPVSDLSQVIEEPLLPPIVTPIKSVPVEPPSEPVEPEVAQSAAPLTDAPIAPPLPISETAPVVPSTETSSQPLPAPLPVVAALPVLPHELPPQNPSTASGRTSDIPDLPPTPSQPKSSGSFAKYFFVISLIFFLVIAGLVVNSFLNKQKAANNNSTVPVPESTPTATATSAVCTVNDKGYQLGESFTAEDGCNTCTCTEGGSISCTEVACDNTKGGLETDTNPEP